RVPHGVILPPGTDNRGSPSTASGTVPGSWRSGPASAGRSGATGSAATTAPERPSAPGMDRWRGYSDPLQSYRYIDHIPRHTHGAANQRQGQQARRVPQTARGGGPPAGPPPMDGPYAACTACTVSTAACTVTATVSAMARTSGAASATTGPSVIPGGQRTPGGPAASPGAVTTTTLGQDAIAAQCMSCTRRSQT